MSDTQPTAVDEENRDTDLAEDVDGTIDQLAALIELDSSRQMQTPFGSMTEADLLGLIRPSLFEWVASDRERALRHAALIHRSTGDLLEKHAERDAEELAAEAIERLDDHE